MNVQQNFIDFNKYLKKQLNILIVSPKQNYMFILYFVYITPHTNRRVVFKVLRFNMLRFDNLPGVFLKYNNVILNAKSLKM